ncbi:MAG: WG repeat-containing protein [bacterium]|nr:WG repeat-containing protein [bacterium]
MIDTSGQRVLEGIEGGVSEFHEGLARVPRDGRSGYIDRTGEFVIPATLLSAGDFSEGLAPVEAAANGQRTPGYIDASGTLVLKANPAHYQLGRFSEGLASFATFRSTLISDRQEHGFIDRAGKVVIPPEFDEARSFSEGFAAVRVGEKWGFVDKQGNMAIPARYDFVTPFSEGTATVCRMTLYQRVRMHLTTKRTTMVIPAETASP